MKRLIAPAVAVVVVVVVIVLVASSGSSHRLSATFMSATNLVTGARVTAGGEQIGTVSGVSLRGGLADVKMHISNNSVWPLPRGTQAEIRWGGTVSYSDRYVELLPGPKGNPPLANGAQLPTTDTVTPVEFDQFFNIFNAPARQSLDELTDRGDATLASRGPALRAGFGETPGALEQVADTLGALGEDPYALQTLVSTGAKTAQALHAREPQLVDLVDGAASTFQTIAQNARDTERTLAKLPAGLQAAQTMLGELNPTLTRLGSLVHTIAPGAGQLRSLASPLSSAIHTLGAVAPELNSTLATVQDHGAAVTSFLDTSQPVLSELRPVLSSLAPMLGCLRPYAPEIAGWFSTWQSMGSYYDADGHYARVEFQAFPFIDDDPATPAQIVADTPGLGYALLRPPGYGVGQTWYQPQCDAGPSGLNPADDPEANGG
ncbi:MAG TPA: MlaD family protein [Solirubrobacteraceae bacterium]|nr:MlaD family protein [Solirubrobacteraceae bacterium]